MRVRRLSVCASLALLALIACSETSEQSAGGAPTSGAGGAGGDGGSGGAVVSSGATGGAAPLTCDTGSPPSDVPEGACDLLAQDCPGGAACMPAQKGSDWTTECTPDGGLKGPKKECADHDECQGGLRCVFGFCSPVCCPDTAEPCDGGTCNVELTFGPYFVTYCSFLTPCALFEVDACPDGQDCHALGEQGISICAAPSASPKQEGEACKYLNDCGDMQNCYPPGVPNAACRYVCKLGTPTGAPGTGGCPAGQTCTDVALGIAGVGICEP